MSKTMKLGATFIVGAIVLFCLAVRVQWGSYGKFKINEGGAVGRVMNYRYYRLKEELDSFSSFRLKALERICNNDSNELACGSFADYDRKAISFASEDPFWKGHRPAVICPNHKQIGNAGLCNERAKRLLRAMRQLEKELDAEEDVVKKENKVARQKAELARKERIVTYQDSWDSLVNLAKQVDEKWLDDLDVKVANGRIVVSKDLFGGGDLLPCSREDFDNAECVTRIPEVSGFVYGMRKIETHHRFRVIVR